MGNDDGPYTNYYRHCGIEWEDRWSCMCDDECPVCGQEIEPYDSDEDEGEDEDAGNREDAAYEEDRQREVDDQREGK